ncbi:ATP-binding protein [candidate division KSB1 bacterium]|nr:ATP-binding protein [candidate division KSB1 bacterium]
MNKITSLKARILMFMGSIIIILLLTISISALYHWRNLILKNQQASALMVTQAFSVSILDALIYQESGLLPNEGYLENQVHNFLKKNPQIKFIFVYDQNGQMIVRNTFHESQQLSQELKNIAFTDNFEAVTRIHQYNSYGWITEVTIPLQIYGKSWGALKIGFESETTRTRIKQLFFLLFSLTLIVVILILTAIYFLIDRLTKSLSQLVSEMNRLDFDHAIPSEMQIKHDEIDFLVMNFEKMKQRLTQSRKQLLEAQKQVHHAEKLASVGRLASGVAHEINNPLNGIKNCLYAIEKEPENLPQTKTYLDLANEGLDHITMIVQKLLGFSRQQSKQVAPINLNENIETVLSLLRFRLEKNNIEIVTHFNAKLPLIHADPHLIQEVIMNLLLNSFDSIEAQGQIRITTEQETNTTVRMTITDTGCGIPENNLDKIFDPFFTTKDEGKGTGLGLSVSLGIVENHGGTIRVTSKPQTGTTFYVTLPIQGAA